MLNCLGSAIQGDDQVVSAEEVFELRFRHANCARRRCNAKASKQFTDAK